MKMQSHLGPTPAKTWTFNTQTVLFLRLISVDWLLSVAAGPGNQRTTKSLSLLSRNAIRLSNQVARQSIALSICPLVKGDLEIVGARCKLFDDVWTFHPFSVKGQLLQNTQENRANRIRSEPVLLKSRVEDDMPRLSARLISSRSDEVGRVIQGEISSWTLRVSNLGTAPASSVHSRRTFHGSVSTLGIAEAITQKVSPHHRCVGPSGTLLWLPLEGEGSQSRGTDSAWRRSGCSN
jgi:hypothetical protein